jgi:hypothetical protein
MDKIYVVIANDYFGTVTVLAYCDSQEKAQELADNLLRIYSKCDICSKLNDNESLAFEKSLSFEDQKLLSDLKFTPAYSNDCAFYTQEVCHY